MNVDHYNRSSILWKWPKYLKPIAFGEPFVLSLKGSLKVLKGKLEQEATEIGMALFYMLVTLAEEWLSEKFSEDTGMEDAEEDEAATDDIIVPYGEPVTNDTFLAWHERFEAELALERAKCVS
ncbi:hypothetical protein Pfo_019947 [Paulownia fortunei]|nr:hypothetical protein Pfo_019947 [Paulownia fortunei]